MATKVFIGSTSNDLKSYRNAAIDICNRLRLVPVAMEFFEAMSVGATSGSKQKLDQSDLYVGILAHRYGYIEEGNLKSVTEIEFDYAGELKLDRLCFLVDPTYPWPPDTIDFKNYEQLQRFKSGIDQSLIRAQFSDVNDFKAKLLHSLIEWLEKNQLRNTDVLLPTSEGLLSLAAAPPLPSILFGREHDCRVLKERMGIFDGGTRKATTIVHGWPGVGKTALMRTLAHDNDVETAFPDGILWTSVGEHPSHIQGLNVWGQALGARMSHVQTLDQAMTQVRAMLKNKRCLLIIDDVWDKDAASPYKIGGTACVTMITTRFLDVARELSVLPEEIFLLGTLSNESGYELLEKLAPKVASLYHEASHQLVGDLEGLPLAIRVAARLLEAEEQNGFDIQEAFRTFRESHELLKAVAPSDRFDSKSGTTPTIELLLKKSTDRLDVKTRKCFAYLGAFAPKPATFDLDAMEYVWSVDDARPTARKLVDRGLLEPLPTIGRFWMHAVLVMHASMLLNDYEG